MKNILIVGLGGFAGSIARYKLGGLVLHHVSAYKFPLSTFSINVLGCLIIGLLGGYFEKHQFFSTEVILLLFTGLLGGFTTFSAFGFETVYLIKRGLWGVGLLYVMASVGCGLLAVWTGLFIGEIVRS